MSTLWSSSLNGTTSKPNASLVIFVFSYLIWKASRPREMILFSLSSSRELSSVEAKTIILYLPSIAKIALGPVIQGVVWFGRLEMRLVQNSVLSQSVKNDCGKLIDITDAFDIYFGNVCRRIKMRLLVHKTVYFLLFYFARVACFHFYPFLSIPRRKIQLPSARNHFDLSLLAY